MNIQDYSDDELIQTMNLNDPSDRELEERIISLIEKYKNNNTEMMKNAEYPTMMMMKKKKKKKKTTTMTKKKKKGLKH